MLTVKALKEQIANLPDDMEVYFRRVAPICGNVEPAYSAELSEVSFFGKAEACLIIEPSKDDDNQ